MNFKKITIDDIEIIKPYFNLPSSRTCDYSVGGMFMWRNYFDMDYTINNGTFFSRLRDRQGNLYFNLPISECIEEAIRDNVSLCYEKDTGIKFTTVPEEYLQAFLKICPDAKIIEQTDYFDYLYSASDLINLSGSKYHSQRNLISQFKAQNPNWEFLPLDAYGIKEIIDFFKQYTKSAVAEETAVVENEMTLEILENMDKYNMVGGILLADNKIVGFSLGEIIRDTLFVHVEKADKGYKGAYQMLAKEFPSLYGSEISFVNREEDMGSLGLRKSKMAYNPISLLKKYIVEVI